ncbi:sigma-54-dependent Fis family transcriptional regulator, partial [Pseudomonas aeruginosa]|nr:sigma-54-dependent Fis family transcriptional regulator [Pseudomonas aeruginosa]
GAAEACAVDNVRRPQRRELFAGSPQEFASQLAKPLGAPGTELIKLAEGIPVLIMTSYASLRSAVDSMKMGAV